MKRSPILLALALSCLLPAAALAKNPVPPKQDPKPIMTEQQAQALNKCMLKCQEPMKSCMDECKGDDNCNMKCGTKFSECLSKTCGDQLPKPPPQK